MFFTKLGAKLGVVRPTVDPRSRAVRKWHGSSMRPRRSFCPAEDCHRQRCPPLGSTESRTASARKMLAKGPPRAQCRRGSCRNTFGSRVESRRSGCAGSRVALDSRGVASLWIRGGVASLWMRGESRRSGCAVESRRSGCAVESRRSGCASVGDGNEVVSNAALGCTSRIGLASAARACAKSRCLS